MSNSVIVAIVVPIVVAIALAGWIVAVYRADRHPQGGRPERSHRSVPRREVAGGSFRGSGGRQVMPRRDSVPAEAAGDPAQKGGPVPAESAAQEATTGPHASQADQGPSGRPDTPAGL
jgi:hypothetical protein